MPDISSKPVIYKIVIKLNAVATLCIESSTIGSLLVFHRTLPEASVEDSGIKA